MATGYLCNFTILFLYRDRRFSSSTKSPNKSLQRTENLPRLSCSPMGTYGYIWVPGITISPFYGYLVSPSHHLESASNRDWLWQSLIVNDDRVMTS